MELSRLYFLDTNVVIYLIGGRLALPLPEGNYSVSVITEIELLSFPELTAAEEQSIHRFLQLVESVQLTATVRDKTIQIRRNNRLKLPYAIIAASALIHNAILLTNDNVFAVIEELSVESVQLSSN